MCTVGHVFVLAWNSRATRIPFISPNIERLSYHIGRSVIVVIGDDIGGRFFC